MQCSPIGSRKGLITEQEKCYMHHNVIQDFVWAKYMNGSEKEIKKQLEVGP